MLQAIRKLSLGVTLIILASAILLLSESQRSKPGDSTANVGKKTERQLKVAMFQVSSQPIIEEGAMGVLDGLAEAGYVAGPHFKISRFNSQGDIATASAIAQELADGGYDLVITLTTGALQAMANANKQGQTRHVFGLVSDPIRAGVGIGTEPLDHPSQLVGVGTLPPVDEAIRLALKINPKLRRIGLPWNPAEINSEICTLVARKTCQELDLELMEANVENVVAIKDAVDSLIDRKSDALLIGGDVTVLSAVDLVVNAGNEAHIPVFTCMPGNAKHGTLFDVGADYLSVGRIVGRLAARVLDGEEISKLPVEIAIPPKLFLNKLALSSLQQLWVFPPDLIEQAQSIIDETGQHDKLPAAATSNPGVPKKKWELRAISYINSKDAEEAEQGLREGLKLSGLSEGRDFAFKTSNAQGDMSTLNGLVDAAISDHADMLLTVSTPTLQCSIQRAREIPIVFTMVANPFAAGAGTSEAVHLPNVTGAYGACDVYAMMPIIRQLMPKAKRLGTIFAPSEINSVFNHDLMKLAAKEAGYELISMGADSASEVSDSARSLCDQQIDLICLANSNLISSSYPAVAQAAGQVPIPVFGFLGGIASQGAVVVLSRDYYDMGVDSGRLAARIIRGEPPSAINFHQTVKNQLIVNTAAARACRIDLPKAFLKSADRIIDK